MNGRASVFALVTCGALLSACSGGGGGSTPVGSPPVSGGSSPTSSASPVPGASISPAPTASKSPAPIASASSAPAPTQTPASSPTPGAAPEVTRTILPSTADTAGSYSPDDPNYVINPDPSVTPAHKLFVFLPGTGAAPLYYTYIVQEAAARGYHGIGLDYPNPTTLNTQCQTQPPSCWAPIHYNTLYGMGTGPVNPTNSIDNRLEKLLTYLQATYPTEGWGQYLSGGAALWSSIVISGHSQGGAHAAYIAKEAYDVGRACLFSAPYDTNANGDADWILDTTHATPPGNMFAFINTMDDVETPANDYRLWQEMGMGSNEFSVDNASAPYGSSQTLVTSHAPQVAATDATHGEPVADRYTPVDANGVPVHKPVWDYNCFP